MENIWVSALSLSVAVIAIYDADFDVRRGQKKPMIKVHVILVCPTSLTADDRKNASRGDRL